MWDNAAARKKPSDTRHVHLEVPYTRLWHENYLHLSTPDFLAPSLLSTRSGLLGLAVLASSAGAGGQSPQCGGTRMSELLSAPP